MNDISKYFWVNLNPLRFWLSKMGNDKNLGRQMLKTPQKKWRFIQIANEMDVIKGTEGAVEHLIESQKWTGNANDTAAVEDLVGNLKGLDNKLQLAKKKAT